MSKFCDFTIIKCQAGLGGNGSSHFRREKFIDRGGPDGGDGGRGGDIVFKANQNENTLIEFHTKKQFKAEEAGNGQKGLMHGADGEDLILELPVGTMIYDQKTGKLLADLNTHDQLVVIARGGRGGLGNAHFKSSTNRSPTFSEQGEPGEIKELKLELKLVANVGIIGIPSAGKSTLISRISNSRPKIADYPFTTLIPNLGVVDMRKFDKRDHFSFIVTDVPGLIEGAHLGKGLGHEFLRHISRNQILIHLVDGTSPDPLNDYKVINKELKLFDPKLAHKEQIVVVNKIDAISTEDLAAIIKKLEKGRVKLKDNVYAISAVTGENLEKLMFAVAEKVKAHKDNFTTELPSNDEVTVIQPGQRHNKATVKFVRKKIDPVSKKTRQVFDVLHPRLEQVVKMTDLEDREGIERVYHYIERLGIKNELRKRGAQPGDKLRIGGVDGTVIRMRE